MWCAKNTCKSNCQNWFPSGLGELLGTLDSPSMPEDLAERQKRQQESKALLDTGSQPSFWRHYCWFPVVLVACVLMFGLYYAYVRVAEKELGDDDDGTR